MGPRHRSGSEPEAIREEKRMSAPLFGDDILYLQRFLKCCGLYTGPLDAEFSTEVGDAEDDWRQTMKL